MSRIVASLTFAALLGFAVAAHATPITITPGTYSLNDAYADGLAITGTITLDSSGVVTKAGDHLTWDGLMFTSVPTAGLYGTSPNWSQDYIAGNYGQIKLEFSVTPTGGVDLTVCTSTNKTACTANGSSAYSTLQYYGGGPVTTVESSATVNLTSGPSNAGTQAYLAFVPTPEPSSLMLLGTGVLGVAGVLRRRLRQA